MRTALRPAGTRKTADGASWCIRIWLAVPLGASENSPRRKPRVESPKPSAAPAGAFEPFFSRHPVGGGRRKLPRSSSPTPTVIGAFDATCPQPTDGLRPQPAQALYTQRKRYTHKTKPEESTMRKSDRLPKTTLGSDDRRTRHPEDNSEHRRPAAPPATICVGRWVPALPRMMHRQKTVIIHLTQGLDFDTLVL